MTTPTHLPALAAVYMPASAVGYIAAAASPPVYNAQPHPPTHLCLQQCVCQLWVVQQQLPCLLWVVLDEPFHLLHQFKHLLRGQARHSLRDHLRGILWGDGGAMEGGLWGWGQRLITLVSGIQVCDVSNELEDTICIRWVGTKSVPVCSSIHHNNEVYNSVQ